MSASTRYREIEVRGTPRQMGEQLGEEAREEIRGFDAVALERVNLTVAVSEESALAVAADSIRRVAAYAPEMLEELNGMAASSGVPAERLMLLQVRNQLRPDDGGCTSFALSQPAAAGTFVGQNWDNDPELDPFTIVLTRRPEGEPAFMSISQAGLVAYIGVSDAGIGLCMNTLPAPCRQLGVPHYFTVRGMYRAGSLGGALEAVRRAERAIPANLILAAPDGLADFEITIGDVHVIGDDGTGIVTHTNHCVHPDLAPVNDDFPELIQSGPRKCRVDELLRRAPRPLTEASLREILSDHDGHPHSICRHVNDHPENGYWTSVFSVIIDVGACRMQVSRGNPCEAPYETYHLN